MGMITPDESEIALLPSYSGPIGKNKKCQTAGADWPTLTKLLM